MKQIIQGLYIYTCGSLAPIIFTCSKLSPLIFVKRFNIRILENFHILLWLLKDLAWSHEYKLLGTLMTLPTITLAVYFTIRSKNNKFNFLPNVSVVCWIVANSLWMLTEFFTLNLMTAGRVLFITGIITIVYWIIFIMPSFLRLRRETR